MSSCPSFAWWPALFTAGLSCRDIVAVDVGSNKGYVIASWLDVFRPELGITPLKLYMRLQKSRFAVNGGFDCGACGDCNEDHMPVYGSHTCSRYVPGDGAAGQPKVEVVPTNAFKLTVHALEPVPANQEVLEVGIVTMVDELENNRGTYRGHEHGGTKVVLHKMAAMGDSSVTSVPFGKCPPGREICSIAANGSSAGTNADGTPVEIVQVAASTVDNWAAKNGIEVIDILTIDTEGFDPDVIRGTDRMLQRGAVRILEFEYHHLRLWQTNSLEGIVQRLDHYGYDCFLLQREQMLRLTNCWIPGFEFKNWANVMCVLRADTALSAVVARWTPLSGQ